jgi:hypothetical protein
VGFLDFLFGERSRDRAVPPPLPRIAIAGARDGQPARFVGQVAAVGETLVAPLSGRPCVHYVVAIDSVQVMQKAAWVIEDLGTWRDPPPGRLAHDERGVPFVVSDESGRALVDPRGAYTDLGQDWYHLTEVDPLSERESAYLVERGLQAHIGRPLALREAILQPGDRILVQGTGTREPDPDPPAPKSDAYRENAWRLRVAALPGRLLFLSERADLGGQCP